MKRTCAFILACVFGTSFTAPAQKAGDVIFSGIQVHTINIRFYETNYWDSLTYFYNRGDEQYIPAQVVINNVAYDSVGVRFKGNSSFTHPNNKKSFRLGFDEYIDSLRWDGLKGVHINNMWGDPSFMREKIHLDFLREAGVAAPRANYVKLFINDTLFAFYSLVEHVDKTFLDTRFSNKAGDLFKAVDGYGDTDSLYSDFQWMGADTAQYYSRYELKTDDSKTAWPQLIGFIDTLSNGSDQTAFLARKADMPQVLSAWAADNLLGNLDSYIGSGRNFYVYFHSKTGTLKWIVWDAGLSFGAYGTLVPNPKTLGVTWYNSTLPRPFLGAVMNSVSLRTDYLQALCTFAHTRFTEAIMFPHVDSVANMIRPHVAQDTRKMYTSQQFEANIVSDISATGGGSVTKPGIKSFITQRGNSVKTQLAALGITCVSAIETAPDAPRLWLGQNYPNPVSYSARFSFMLPVDGRASLRIHDALGRVAAVLVDAPVNAGKHSADFDAATLPPGVYQCVLTQGTARITRPLTVSR